MTADNKTPLIDQLKIAATSNDTSNDKMLLLEAAERLTLIAEQLEVIESKLKLYYNGVVHANQSSEKGIISSIFSKLF